MSVFAATPALLVLADGTSYKGWSFGATGTAIGEVVFNTAMTGYQEVATDPSYLGQIVTFTYPELGNTGVNPKMKNRHILGFAVQLLVISQNVPVIGALLSLYLIILRNIISPEFMVLILGH